MSASKSEGPRHHTRVRPARVIASTISAIAANLGNGSGPRAVATIWNPRVLRKPRTRGAAGSARLIMNTRYTVETTDGRRVGQVKVHQTRGGRAPASRAAS